MADKVCGIRKEKWEVSEGNHMRRGFMTYISQQLLGGLQITEGEMVGACSLYKGKREIVQVFVGETWKTILTGRSRHRGDLILD